MSSNRHLMRVVAMQSLYEWEFRKSKADLHHHQTGQKELHTVLDRDLGESAERTTNKDFALQIVDGVLEHFDEIQGLIIKYAPEWPLDQIAAIDRAVLYVGIYEVLYGASHEVPPVVAINEAIDIAKEYGSENSGKFINGVLSTVLKSVQQD